MTDFLNFKTLKRPASPNTYLVAPHGLCEHAEIDDASPVIEMSARGLFSTLSEMIAQERHWVDLEADAETLRLKFVAKTPLLKFKDDVDIMVIAPDTTTDVGVMLAIYSRSRVGYSDMGANRKRVSRILQELTIK
ncbi:MAG: DUF1499 domain-containing protein [Pseudomonadota bacterium]